MGDVFLSLIRNLRQLASASTPCQKRKTVQRFVTIPAMFHSGTTFASDKDEVLAALNRNVQHIGCFSPQSTADIAAALVSEIAGKTGR